MADVLDALTAQIDWWWRTLFRPRLMGLTDDELSEIDLDSVDYFPVMQAIGEGMVNYLRQRAAEKGHALFEHDLVSTTDPAVRGHELLVTRAGEVARIRAQLSNPDWVDSQEP